jgi:hypothetical protein
LLIKFDPLPNAPIKDMKYYISVTGLEVKSLLYLPWFFKHAVASTIQAQAAEGNVSTQVTLRNGVRHTLTVWENKTSMLRYLRAGAHAEAMKATNKISKPGSTKVYGYESDASPTWDEALALWEVHGMRHGKVVKTPATTMENNNKRSLHGTKMAALLTVMAIVSVAAFSAFSSPTLFDQAL